MTNNKTKNVSFFTLRHREGLVCLFLVMVSLAVYWQVGNHDFISFDDRVYVTENSHVQAGLTPDSITWAFTATDADNWHPLTWLSHMADCQIYGLNPRGHHLTNLLFHILNSILLFLIFRRMTGSLWKSAFVAALFAIHPLHVESVAWVAERKDVLSTFFWMLTMGSYVWYVERSGTGRYLLVLLFFALGLMAKPMLVTLPFVLLLLDYWPLERLRAKQLTTNNQSNSEARANKKSDKRKPKKSKEKEPVIDRERRNLSFQWTAVSRIIYEKIPFLILSFLSCIITVYAQQRLIQPLESLSLSVRFGNALISYNNYLIKMIWPFKLAFFYPHSITVPLWQVATALIFLVVVSSVAIMTIKRYQYFATGWFWYLGTLLPVIGIVQIATQSMADRYTYIPLIGIFIIISWGIPDLAQRLNYKYRKIILASAGGIVLGIFITTASLQVRYWNNSITLFQHALDTTTKNDVMHNNMGIVLFKEGRISEAINHFTKAIIIDPYYVAAHSNLGDAFKAVGEIDQAKDQYLKVLTIEPQHSKAHLRLGNIFFEQNKLGKAIFHFSEVVRLDPNFAHGHVRLGHALVMKGSLDDAVKSYLKAMAIEPGNASTCYNLGNVYSKMGNLEAAIEYYSKALIIDPASKEGHNNLGNVLMRYGKIEEAISHFRESLRLDPDFELASHNLEKALVILRKLDISITRTENTLKADPENPELHYDLGNLYYRKGKLDEAIHQYQKSLSLQPDALQVLNNLAIVYITKKEYDKAVSILSRIAELQPDNADIYYNIACMYSIQNNVEKSIDSLKKAIEKGYNNWNLIKTDKDLENIRNSLYYKNLMKSR